jgi:hypothetical protein
MYRVAWECVAGRRPFVDVVFSLRFGVSLQFVSRDVFLTKRVVCMPVGARDTRCQFADSDGDDTDSFEAPNEKQWN